VIVHLAAPCRCVPVTSDVVLQASEVQPIAAPLGARAAIGVCCSRHRVPSRVRGFVDASRQAGRTGGNLGAAQCLLLHATTSRPPLDTCSIQTSAQRSATHGVRSLRFLLPASTGHATGASRMRHCRSTVSRAILGLMAKTDQQYNMAIDTDVLSARFRAPTGRRSFLR